MTRFRAMGCAVEVSDDAAVDDARRLFDERDRRFSRFRPDSELSRLNRVPAGASLVSEEFSRMLGHALGAARSTGGLVTPTIGAAITGAGYDADFDLLPTDGAPVAAVEAPPVGAISLRGRLLVRAVPIELDLNCVVKGATVDDALALLGGGFVAAGGDVATSAPLVVGLPGGGAVTLQRGGLATSSVAIRRWRRGGALQHHLIDPSTGRPAEVPWRDVTVSAASCLAADVAAKAALLLGHAGPSWLDRRGLAGRFVDYDGGVHLNETWRQAVPLGAAA
ncbi:MAG TPA: FAD:protein FMN transferase [Gaiellaceae bacterium]|nr:FAD:protein FMN transferase [Gaiellaceae bacterium]